MDYYFRNLKNIIDFYLRQVIKISRKNYNEKNESKDDLFGVKEQVHKEKYLFDKYDLDFVKTNTTKENYLENLYTIELLDRYLDVDFTHSINVLDIGCKNWFYAKGEYSFFKKYCVDLNLDGIEIDVNRLYSNLYSRKEVAKFHIKNLEGTNYIEDDFLNHEEKYDYIIWILPFVLKYPLYKWGLPESYFKPEEMLMHAYKSLNRNGQIFIINQGEEEYEAQKSLCEKLNISYKHIGKIESIFSTYKQNRYLVLINK